MPVSGWGVTAFSELGGSSSSWTRTHSDARRRSSASKAAPIRRPSPRRAAARDGPAMWFMNGAKPPATALRSGRSRCRRCAPCRCCPRPAPPGSPAKRLMDRVGWIIRLRPAVPEVLPISFIISSFGVSNPCAAITNAPAVLVARAPSGPRWEIAATRPRPSRSSWSTAASAISRAPAARASASPCAPDRLAPMGQLGLQLLLLAQAGRPRRVRDGRMSDVLDAVAHRRGRDRKTPHQFGSGLGQQGEGARAGWVGGAAARAVQADLPLGLRAARLQLVVVEGPVPAHAELGGHAHLLRREAPGPARAISGAASEPSEPDATTITSASCSAMPASCRSAAGLAARAASRFA